MFIRDAEFEQQLLLKLKGTAHYRVFFPMACCELLKVNLTIIIIQRIMREFDCTFDCAFDKSNVCGSHSNVNV